MKIAIVGGPAAGKTTVFGMLAGAVRKDKRESVAFVSEVATEIINGIQGKVSDVMTRLQFQQEVYRRQLEAEAAVGDIRYVFLDRGIADVFVYLDEETARTFVKETEAEALAAYDVAVFLFGERENHTRDTDTCRLEKDEAEIALWEQKTFEVWRKHPRIIAVSQCETVHAKAKTVAGTLNKVLNEEIFDLSLI